MKKLIFVLLFSCCTQLDPVEEIIGSMPAKGYRVDIRFQGLGLEEENFSNARTIADWSHVLSDSIGILHIVKQDSSFGFREEYPYSGMGSMNVTLSLGNYYASIKPASFDFYGLVFEAVSPLFDSRSGDLLVPVSTNQGLVLINSDITNDSTPRLISGNEPYELFGSHLGFHYLYLTEIASDRYYRIEWYGTDGRRHQTDITGLQRETYYYIDSINDGTRIRFDLDGLFKDEIIIDG